MPKLNFTAASLRSFFETNGPGAVAYDTQQRGLFAYQTSAGHISLGAHFRLGGKTQIKKTISRLGELSVAEARHRVAALVVAGKSGEDVLGDRRRKAEQDITLGEISRLHRESMITRRCSPASIAVYEGTWRTKLARYQNRPLSSFTKGEIVAMHKGWRSTGPCAANRAVRLLSVLFNFAAKKVDGPMIANPTRAVDLWPERLKRDVLPFEALAEWWEGVCAMPNKSHAAYFKLLLYTGLRRTDAAQIKLEDIHDNFVFRPSPKGGAKKAFQCPITPQLRVIIHEALRARELVHPRSEFLFPAHGKAGHIRGQWHDQQVVGGMSAAPHVLRRTYISAGASIGINFIHLKALANHIGHGGDVTLTSYIKVPFEDRMAAACRIADFLDTKIGGLTSQPTKLLQWQGDLPEANAAE
jgi:integrase